MKNLLIFLALTLVGCNSATKIPQLEIAVTDAVFICNEGGFMYGNASLSVYDRATKQVHNQAFYNVNGFPLGDVLQSMAIIDGRGYLVVNNSGKVIVIDPVTCKYLGAITGLISPRYIQKIDDTRLYITDLYGSSIAIVNPQTLLITGRIAAGGSTEQMVRYSDYIYVTSWSFNNKVYKVDTKTDKIVDSVTVNKQPNSIIIDKNDKLWVLSDGAYKGSPYGQQDAALTRIDAANFTVEQVLEFNDNTLAPSELAINAARDTIYYISGNANKSNGIFCMNIADTSLPQTPFIAANGALFYALGISPTGEIYVSDAIDYLQRGTVFIYNGKGEQLEKFKVDIIPGSFCFFTTHTPATH